MDTVYNRFNTVPECDGQTDRISISIARQQTDALLIWKRVGRRYAGGALWLWRLHCSNDLHRELYSNRAQTVTGKPRCAEERKLYSNCQFIAGSTADASQCCPRLGSACGLISFTCIWHSKSCLLRMQLCPNGQLFVMSAVIAVYGRRILTSTGRASVMK